MRAEFYELQEGTDGRFGVIVVVIEFLEKQHLSSGREQEFVSVQSFKKQKEWSSTGLCTDRAREACVFLHRTRGRRTDRASVEVALHGSLHGPCPLFGVARVINMGHVPEACALIFGVARGVPSSTRTVLNGCTGLGLGCTGRVRAASSVLHGACNSARVKLIFCTGRAISFF